MPRDRVVLYIVTATYGMVHAATWVEPVSDPHRLDPWVGWAIGTACVATCLSVFWANSIRDPAAQLGPGRWRSALAWGAWAYFGLCMAGGSHGRVRYEEPSELRPAGRWVVSGKRRGREVSPEEAARAMYGFPRCVSGMAVGQLVAMCIATALPTARDESLPA